MFYLKRFLDPLTKKVEVVCLIIDLTYSRHFACFSTNSLSFSFGNSSFLKVYTKEI